MENMQLDTSTIMMIVFVFSFVISMWKVYAFLPNKELADDDTTPASQEELIKIVKKHLTQDISSKELLELVKNDASFDKKHFWRFNENKLNQLLIKIK
ncbi:MAG: hypothetical protein Q9M32_03015 [Sulfurimonas sp.]|nr:hypothetical protein [Sulfurimonas sp.]